MRCLTFPSIAFLWAVTAKSCGAWVYPLQNSLDDRPTAASESVHEALVKAAIIPDGGYAFDGSIEVACPIYFSTFISAWKTHEVLCPDQAIAPKDNGQSSFTMGC